MPIAPEVLLINKDYLVKYTSLNKAVDADIIESSIILAQDTHVEAITGSALMRALKDGDYEALLDDYVRRAICWWAYADVLGKLYVKADAGGLFMRTAENGEQITAEEYRMKRSEAESIARSYSKKLNDYLQANNNDFPELTQNTSPDVSPQGNPYKRTRIRVSSGSKVERRRANEKYL